MYFTQNTQLLSDLFNLRRTIISLNRRTWPILFLRACAHSLGSVQGPPICNRGICHINWIQFNLMNGLINQSWCFSPITRISSDGDLKAKVRIEKLASFLNDANAKLPYCLLNDANVNWKLCRQPDLRWSCYPQKQWERNQSELPPCQCRSCVWRLFIIVLFFCMISFWANQPHSVLLQQDLYV